MNKQFEQQIFVSTLWVDRALEFLIGLSCLFFRQKIY